MDTSDVVTVADEMFEQCLATGQSARRVDETADAEPLREALRELAKARQVRIRTALMDDVVVVARTDADIWNDDTATMRAKLTPPT